MIMIPVIAIYGESVSKSLFGTDKIGPATLVIAGQYVSGLFCTPLLMFAICWLAFRTDKRIRMGRTSAICLVVSVIAITACILISTVMKLLG